jgi:hypothetical protein
MNISLTGLRARPHLSASQLPSVLHPARVLPRRPGVEGAMKTKTQTHLEEDRVALVLDTGWRIESYGNEYAAGAQVTVYDPSDVERGHWVVSEWAPRDR